MRICIDSNQFIFGIEGSDPASEELMMLLPHLEVVVPRLVIREVTRNLSDAQIRAVHVLLNRAPQATIVDEPVPADLVTKYVGLGLPEKADAVIGAFAEWQGAEYLISDNRHFLQDLSTEAFEVLRPDEFLQRYYQDLVSTADK
jgi:hypothetical protein